MNWGYQDTTFQQGFDYVNQGCPNPGLEGEPKLSLIGNEPSPSQQMGQRAVTGPGTGSAWEYSD